MLGSVDDRQLLQRITAHDADALSVLYEVYYVRLARFLLRVTQDTELTAELINDVFMVIWEKAHSFRGESSVSSWIFGIAYHKGIKAAKRRRWEQPVNDISDLAADDELPIEHNLLERDTHNLLSRLSPEHRAVIELTYYFGYSYREISELLDCPENTVKTRMFYARRTLRAMMEAPTID